MRGSKIVLTRKHFAASVVCLRYWSVNSNEVKNLGTAGASIGKRPADDLGASQAATGAASARAARRSTVTICLNLRDQPNVEVSFGWQGGAANGAQIGDVANAAPVHFAQGAEVAPVGSSSPDQSGLGEERRCDAVAMRRSDPQLLRSGRLAEIDPAGTERVLRP